MSDRYRIRGPALVSFSGGRTSAYMLHEIVQAYGGRLPDDIVVTFANTGREREETLRFVHECGSRWGVQIHWLEWRLGAPGFEEVGFNSAARNGEPFAALIAHKQRLPNWQERWCTEFLKVRPMFAFMRARGLEPGQYTETIGLRDDEGVRIFRGLERAASDGRRVAYPLAEDGVRKSDVLAFWRKQPFDLGLKQHEGNCDLCFLKGRSVRKAIIRDDVSRADWWLEQERTRNGSFDRRDCVSDLVAEVLSAPMFDFDSEEHDVECGLTCGSFADAEVMA